MEDCKLEVTKNYRNFLRVKLNYDNRKRLSNHNFSIIASNCIGGVISHELGERFNSPTVNLYILPHDYIKFLKSLPTYINEKELKIDIQESDRVKHPVGILKDIKIYFVHYHSFEEAKEKWYERCERIKWNNLYIFMVERDACNTKDILEFEKLPYNHKILFTAKEREGNSYWHIPKTTGKDGEVIDLCLYKNKYTGKRWIDDFDYVNFINNK